MKDTLAQTLKLYDYSFPKELIATAPAKPRDSARLLVASQEKNDISFDVFRNIGKYLPKGSLLVVNQTRVIPARLRLLKQSGGRVDLLYINHRGKKFQAMADRRLKDGQTLFYNGKPCAKVIGRNGGLYELTMLDSIGILPLLERRGTTPLPPYIKNTPLSPSQIKKEYQTVFAKSGRSVAAPTASLHFSRTLLQQLRKQGIQIAYVNLDVGLGTFAPLKEEQWQTSTLHAEHFSIPRATAAAIAKAKQQERPVIAVGTTVVRTLESAADNGQIKHFSGETSLFIKPGYKFQIVDGLITNFHVPQSSLLMLVSALVGRERLFNLYRQAIDRKLRLFSFGDGMLILPKF